MVYVKKVFLLLSLGIFIILIGCSSIVKDVTISTNNASASATTYPLITRDDSGAEIIILSKPHRIISLLPSSTETLFALNQEDNIIAVTQWDNYPEAILEKDYFLFEDALNPNLETIVDLNPDLILIGSVSGETLRKLRNLDIPVLSYNPQSIEMTYNTIRNIGYVTDSSWRASQVIAAMQEKEKNIQKFIAAIEENDKLRVWLEADSNLFTPGKNTYLNELITKAGGKNIASDIEGWGQYNSEQVIAQNPQVIFYTYGQFVDDASQSIKNRPGWQQIEAVRDNKVLDLDNCLISRPGPRIIDALELIAKNLYPDRF